MATQLTTARAERSLNTNGIATLVFIVGFSLLGGCNERMSDPYSGSQAGSPSTTPTGSQTEPAPTESSPAPSDSTPTTPEPTPAPSPSEPEPAPAPAPEPAPAPAPAPAPSPITCSSTGLATIDLAGQCRAAPTTMGALEIGSGGTTAFASFTGTQADSLSVQLSWQPLDAGAQGYMVYFGKTADTANVFVSDLSSSSGRFDPNAPVVTYNAANDLGLYAGDSACFRIYAYDSARSISETPTLICTRV